MRPRRLAASRGENAHIGLSLGHRRASNPDRETFNRILLRDEESAFECAPVSLISKARIHSDLGIRTLRASDILRL